MFTECDVGDTGAPTINAKKCRRRNILRSRNAMSRIRERPPSTLKNVDGGPLRGAEGDPGASTINARNVDGELPIKNRIKEKKEIKNKKEK
jgi:hypothetical protein